MEARGVFATNQSALQQQAFPLLNKVNSKVKSQPWSYKEMLKYLRPKKKTVAKFPSLSTFLANHLTPEGLEYFHSLTGFLPHYSREPNAEYMYELREKNKNFERVFIRPKKGISTLTKALTDSVVKLGGKMYNNEEVTVIDELGKNKYLLKTTKFEVTTRKVVLAVPIKPLQEIQGSLAEKIKNNPMFKSIGFQVAFKAFALYEEAWWEQNSTGSRRLEDEEECLSNSDCLGFTFPYR